MESPAENRFFTSTRGQVVTLLRTSELTVDDLAATLGLTDNAIRGHLAALEADGLVQRGTPRKGASKPAQTYRLSTQGGRLFPKAYTTVLDRLLRIFGERVPQTEMQDVFREVGHRLPVTTTASESTTIARAEQAVDVIKSLGGSARVEESNGKVMIVGMDCPLAAAVNANPDACLIAESLLTEQLGVPVCQACEHTNPPQCRFEIDPDPD
ncbi:MAG TPA: ArsR family transcriptional regulator [Thermomicrobiales bacterium]|nr:ArsR family transcriptional regulator [Thermomicrobiales bacterium]